MIITEQAKTKLRNLVRARIERDEKKKALQEAERAFREAEDEVYEALDESGVTGSIKVDLGGEFGTVGFRTRETIYAKIIPGKQEQLLEHFEKRAMVDEVSSPEFKKARLNEIAREVYESGGEWPEGLSYYANRGVTITRQKD